MVARQNYILSQQEEERILAQFVEAVLGSQTELADALDDEDWSEILLESCHRQKQAIQPEHRLAALLTTIDADRGIRRMAV